MPLPGPVGQKARPKEPRFPREAERAPCYQKRVLHGRSGRGDCLYAALSGRPDRTDFGASLRSGAATLSMVRFRGRNFCLRGGMRDDAPFSPLRPDRSDKAERVFAAGEDVRPGGRGKPFRSGANSPRPMSLLQRNREKFIPRGQKRTRFYGGKSRCGSRRFGAESRPGRIV